MEFLQEHKVLSDGRKVLKLNAAGNKVAYYVAGKNASGEDKLLEYDVKKGRIIPDKETVKASYDTECNVNYVDPDGKYENVETNKKLHVIDDTHILGVHEYEHRGSASTTKRIAIAGWHCGKDGWYNRFGGVATGKLSINAELKDKLIDMLVE